MIFASILILAASTRDIDIRCGMACDSWSRDWGKWSHADQSRSKAWFDPYDPGDVVALRGATGMRFGSSGATAHFHLGSLPALVSYPPSFVVSWIGGHDDCHGQVYRDQAGNYFALLRMSRSFTREFFVNADGPILVDERGKRIIQLHFPKRVYDLDFEAFWEVCPDGTILRRTQELLKQLASREIHRVRQDVACGRIDDADGLKLQQKLLGVLA